jgi:hypothetical protein
VADPIYLARGRSGTHERPDVIENLGCEAPGKAHFLDLGRGFDSGSHVRAADGKQKTIVQAWAPVHSRLDGRKNALAVKD